MSARRGYAPAARRARRRNDEKANRQVVAVWDRLVMSAEAGLLSAATADWIRSAKRG